mmetsp:Transcript_28972/g.112698  ORF Transcript_28972/g.112698 Transcript_28972/m.112698 type:complete len:82 (-) Transcript_28972:1697-1942(-)
MVSHRCNDSCDRYDIFDGKRKVSFVMEYLSGGELYDIIAESKYFSEEVRKSLDQYIVVVGVSSMPCCIDKDSFDRQTSSIV